MSEQEEIDVEDEVEIDDEEGDMEDALEDLGLDMVGDMESDNDEELEMGDEEMLMTDLPDDDLEVDDEEEVLSPLDLTMASDDEILKVFKAMGEDDGIIVKQDGDDVHLADTEADTEYVIQLGESEDEEEVMETKDEMSEGDEEEEVVYEIEIGEEEVSEEWNEEEMSEEWGGKKGDDSKSHKDYETNEEEMSEEWGGKKGDDSKSHKDYETNEEEEEVTERSIAQGQRASSDRFKGLPKPKTIPNKARYNESLEKEVSQLREKNEEYRKALSIFKEKLNEVAVFNSNLAYATRLFTEHSTTKQEKINILRRFDSVETLKESKSLYKTIKEDLGGKGD
jgi:hypothetical protein